MIIEFMMDEKKIYDLIMSSYVIPTERKFVLISAIKRKTIPQDKLKQIISLLEESQEQIEAKKEDIIEKSKIKFYKVAKKCTEKALINLRKTNIKIKEAVSKKKEWNPDDILDNI